MSGCADDFGADFGADSKGESVSIVHLEINLRRVIKPTGQRAWRYESTVGADCDEQLGLLMLGVFHVFQAMQAKERQQDE